MTSPTNKKLSNRQKLFDLTYYGWPELISLVIYVAAGIALLVVSIQTFQSSPEDTLNAAAKEWTTKTSTYQSEVTSTSASSWSGSVSTTAPSTIVSSNFALMTETGVSIHRWIAPVTSYYLKANLSIASLLASSPVNSKVDLEVTTELNTFSLQLDMNFTTQNFTMNLDDVCSGLTLDTCNQTQKCIEKYGTPLSRNISIDESTTSWNCETPFYNQQNCLNIFKHRNDSGVEVWWPSFDVKGCNYPFSKDTYSLSTVPRQSDDEEIDFVVFAVNDPQIQKKMILKDSSTSNSYTNNNNDLVSVDREDPIPPAVGMMFCALLLLIGSFIMCLKLVPFWYGRYQSGLNLMGPIVVSEENDDDETEEGKGLTANSEQRDNMPEEEEMKEKKE